LCKVSSVCAGLCEGPGDETEGASPSVSVLVFLR